MAALTNKIRMAKTGDETEQRYIQPLGRKGTPLISSRSPLCTGANNLVQAFRRSLDTQIIACVGECNDNDSYGGVGCTALSRRPGHTKSLAYDLYHELLQGVTR